MSLRFARLSAGVTTGLVVALMVWLALFGGCGQKNPTQPLTGMIYVFSDSTGAAIYLDGTDTEQVTPDTLRDVPNGTHVITVRLPGFVSEPESVVVEVAGGELTEALFTLTPMAGSRKVVLLEHFTSVNCGPCPETNEIINGMLATLGPEKVLGIEYHPWPADPFYNAAANENNTRYIFYGVSTLPKIFVEGITSPPSADSAALVQAVEDRLGEVAPVAITVTDTVTGQSWAGRAELFGLSGIVSSDLRGFFVVLEREINYASPPGTNGEKDFLYVMRDILPDPSGEVVNIGAGDLVIIQEEADLHPDVDPTQVYAIYFIQDYVSKEIFQVGTSLPAAKSR